MNKQPLLTPSLIRSDQTFSKENMITTEPNGNRNL